MSEQFHPHFYYILIEVTMTVLCSKYLPKCPIRCHHLSSTNETALKRDLAR